MKLARGQLCVIKSERQKNCRRSVLFFTYSLHRVIKVAKKFADAGRKVTFAVSDEDDFRHELEEYGLSAEGEKPVVAARNEKDEKFVMQADFRSVTTFISPGRAVGCMCQAVCIWTIT